MDKVKLSVIIPVYNTQKYLCQCLDSVLTQTMTDMEIICVNDGSTDSSLPILKEYEKRDRKIRVITKENDGLGAARNTGMEASVGQYVSFVDSDDFIEPDMFQKLYHRAVETGADIAMANVMLYYDDTRQKTPYRDTEKYQALSQKGIFCAEEIPWIVENIGVWDRIYKKDFLEMHSLRNPEHVIYEDALFSFQTMILAKRIIVVDDAYYYYRKRTGTAITDKEIRNDTYKFDFLENCDKIRQFLVNQGVYPIFQKNYLNYFYKNALWHQSNIIRYSIFKNFFKKAKSLAGRQNFKRVLYSNSYTLKVKIYAALLEVDFLLACYLMFFYKRIKIRRTYHGGTREKVANDCSTGL